MTAFAWDDLRLALAIAEGGSLSAAARRLGVNHSTVYRRLGALEARLGTRLFDRDGGRLAATAAGEDLLISARRVETELQGLDRRLAGRDLSLSGSLRLTAPDDIAQQLLVAPLAAFRAAYPGVALELVIDNRMLSLTRREADLAVRPTNRPSESLVGRKIGPLASAVYSLERLGQPTREGPWIGWDEGAGPPALRGWLAGQAAPEAVVYRSNSLLHQLAACRAGIGAAVLPCFLGDGEPSLIRRSEPDPNLTTELWLLTHPDLRRTARVRALMEHLDGAIRSLAPLLAGQVPARR